MQKRREAADLGVHGRGDGEPLHPRAAHFPPAQSAPPPAPPLHHNSIRIYVVTPFLTAATAAQPNCNREHLFIAHHSSDLSLSPSETPPPPTSRTLLLN